jgi:hypothetical protein
LTGAAAAGVAALGAGIAVSRTSNATVTASVALATPKAVPPDLLGVNGVGFRSSREEWKDSRFLAAVADLRPPAFRLFGGTTANYWDWRNGQFVDSPLLPDALEPYRLGQAPLLLPDFTAVARAGGSSMNVVLNMVTSNMSEQLAMLDRLMSSGVRVRRIELGNEMASFDLAGVFPDGATYARVAGQWIDVLRSRWPDLPIGVTANLADASAGRRKATWTDQLVAAQLPVDGYLIHPYVTPETGGSLESLLTSPDQEFGRVSRGLGKFPTDHNIWITETNLMAPSEPVHGTWAHALILACYLILLLQSTRIDQVLVHALYSDVPFGALLRPGPLRWKGFEEPEDWDASTRVSTGTRSATGVVGALFFRAATGRTSVTAVQAPHGPTLDGGRAGLMGICFSNPSNAAVLVNRTSSNLDLTLPDLLAEASVRTTSMELGSIVLDPGTVKTTEGRLPGRRIEMPPHSVCLLEA